MKFSKALKTLINRNEKLSQEYPFVIFASIFYLIVEISWIIIDKYILNFLNITVFFTINKGFVNFGNTLRLTLLLCSITIVLFSIIYFIIRLVIIWFEDEK